MNAARGGERREAYDPERLTALAPERSVRCASCGTMITRAEEACERGGATDHTFTNPAGVTFALRCYAHAEHLVAIGEAMTVFTWFAGYAWQIVHCDSCRAHLGWRFSGEDVFYGLVLDRLSEA